MSFSGLDQSIHCPDCRTDFIFTAGEQKWYLEHDLKEAPKRCRPCRALKKNRAQGNNQQTSAPGPFNDAGSSGQTPQNYTEARPEPYKEERKPRDKDRRRRRDDDNEW